MLITFLFNKHCLSVFDKVIFFINNTTFVARFFTRTTIQAVLPFDKREWISLVLFPQLRVKESSSFLQSIFFLSLLRLDLLAPLLTNKFANSFGETS